MKKNNPTKEYKKIGEHIRTWRELKGIKQEDLAQKVCISPTALSNIETGISKPNIERLEDIAEALEVEVSQLLINPRQIFSINNNLNSTGHQLGFDKSLLERMIEVMEKMTAFFTAKKPN